MKKITLHAIFLWALALTPVLFGACTPQVTIPPASAYTKDSKTPSGVNTADKKLVIKTGDYFKTVNHLLEIYPRDLDGLSIKLKVDDTEIEHTFEYNTRLYIAKNKDMGGERALSIALQKRDGKTFADATKNYACDNCTLTLTCLKDGDEVAWGENLRLRNWYQNFPPRTLCVGGDESDDDEDFEDISLENLTKKVARNASDTVIYSYLIKNNKALKLTNKDDRKPVVVLIDKNNKEIMLPGQLKVGSSYCYLSKLYYRPSTGILIAETKPSSVEEKGVGPMLFATEPISAMICYENKNGKLTRIASADAFNATIAPDKEAGVVTCEEGIDQIEGLPITIEDGSKLKISLSRLKTMPLTLERRSGIAETITIKVTDDSSTYDFENSVKIAGTIDDDGKCIFTLKKNDSDENPKTFTCDSLSTCKDLTISAKAGEAIRDCDDTLVAKLSPGECEACPAQLTGLPVSLSGAELIVSLDKLKKSCITLDKMIAGKVVISIKHGNSTYAFTDKVAITTDIGDDDKTATFTLKGGATTDSDQIITCSECMDLTISCKVGDTSKNCAEALKATLECTEYCKLNPDREACLATFQDDIINVVGPSKNVVEIEMSKVKSVEITPNTGYAITLLEKESRKAESNEAVKGKPLQPFKKKLKVARADKKISFSGTENLPVNRTYTTRTKKVCFSCTKNNRAAACGKAIKQIMKIV